jgi:hypothetical protein
MVHSEPVDSPYVTGLRLFGILVLGYLAVIAAVVVADFLHGAVGLWLSVLWLIAAVAVFGTWRRRRRRGLPS